MKNSIKTLTILMVMFLFSNVSFAVDYTYNGTLSSNKWLKTSSGGSAYASNTQPTLTASDSVTIAGGTWTLANDVTVGGVKLSAGILSLPINQDLTGRVTAAAASTITSSGGRIIGTLSILTGATLNVFEDFQATETILKGGTLALFTKDLNSPVRVLSSSIISATSTGASIQGLTITNGTLTISGSVFGLTTLNMNGGNFSLGSSVVSPSGDISITGNSTISGTGTGRIFSSNTTTVNGGTLTLDNAELTTQDLTFSSDNKITTINDGIFSFTSNNNAISGANANRHINGIIRVYIDNQSKATATYPTGNGTTYAPVRLEIPSSNSILDNVPSEYGINFITFKYFGAKNSNTDIDFTTLAGGVSGTEYWDITSSNASNKRPVSTMTLTFSTAQLSDSTNISNDLELAQYNTSTGKWTVLLAGVIGSGSTRSITTSSAIAPNTVYTFGSVNPRTSFLTPLPVSLIDFAAKANNASIEVKWSTASEKNNSAFVVEKSLDGKTWSAIGTVKGAKTSNVVNNYGLVDYKVVSGFQYYRLKQIDLDGTVNYSKAIAVNYSKASTLNVNVFPNPAKDALNITTENNATGEVNIQILNSMGETVYNQVLEAGLAQSIDIALFIPGVYYVTVIAEGGSKIIRLLKN